MVWRREHAVFLGGQFPITQNQIQLSSVAKKIYPQYLNTILEGKKFASSWLAEALGLEVVEVPLLWNEISGATPTYTVLTVPWGDLSEDFHRSNEYNSNSALADWPET